ncbi:carbohydrate kinase family protein [Shewanella surugensis]|uniref:Carbohydrate kinase n=1 Tax=Shewanella surugensis TaxID=212020 RepID=A0ABT0LF35_9GAMM|nr:carbohydrate kinase [Shewanella surugensis]MCL1125950.1 carbohydrate kinase [Shewanella surugensis]
MSLLAFGEALIDFLSNGGTPETFTKFPGGAPANVTVAYAKLGGKSQFCGMLGQDMFGDYLLTSLNEHNVDTQYCLQTSIAKTALAFVSLDANGERSFSFYRPPAADLLFHSTDFNIQAFTSNNLFHICSNSLTEEAIYETTMQGLSLAKTHRCLRSFDVNLRLNLWQAPQLAYERIWQCIRHCDILKLSREELDFLLSQMQHQQESEFIASCFSHGVSIIMISNGHLPVLYYTPTFCGESQIPNIEVIDTTAAGDAFVGAMLFQLNEYLNKNKILSQLINEEHELKSIMDFATLCGAIACTQKGAFPSLPSMEDHDNFRLKIMK